MLLDNRALFEQTAATFALFEQTAATFATAALFERRAREARLRARETDSCVPEGGGRGATTTNAQTTINPKIREPANLAGRVAVKLGSVQTVKSVLRR